MTNADNVKPYELRDLKADDMFPMFNIISKIGIKEFKACFQSEDVTRMIAAAGEEGKEVDVASVGMIAVFDIAGILMKNIPSCKDDIYLFLSQLSGLSKKEIADLPMITFTNMIVDVIKKEEFKDFFQGVSKLLK